MMKHENDIQLANPTVWVQARKQSGKQRGASMVEFALLIALVALIAIPAVSGLGGSVRAEYNRAADQVAGAGSFQPTPVPCNSNHPNWPFCN